VQTLVASAFPIGRLRLRQGGARDLVATAGGRPPPPIAPIGGGKRGETAPAPGPALTLDKPRIGGGPGPDLEARAPHVEGPGPQALHSLTFW
jgi:hypothetical protein